MKPKIKKALGWTVGIVLAFGVIGAALPEDPAIDASNASFGGGRGGASIQTQMPE